MSQFPEWMGPNIEQRHVDAMGWGTGPVPQLGPAPKRSEFPTGEENNYGVIQRFIGWVGDRQVSVYAVSTVDAMALLTQKKMSLANGFYGYPIEHDGIWFGVGDGAKCVLVVDRDIPSRKR